MKYVVFDWDNTIREGYTLFTWIDYLIQKKYLLKNVRHEIDSLTQSYKKGLITHDEYALHSCRVYAKAMEGKSVRSRDEFIAEYIEYDRKYIFPFSSDLLLTIHELGFEIAIISGAPQFVLEKYKSDFGLSVILGFCEKEHDGFLTGDVLYNHGVQKEYSIEYLKERFGSNPVASFGDSSSDMPLFLAAKYAFVIGKNFSDDTRFHPLTPFDKEIKQKVVDVLK